MICNPKRHEYMSKINRTPLYLAACANLNCGLGLVVQVSYKQFYIRAGEPRKESIAGVEQGFNLGFSNQDTFTQARADRES